VKGAYHVGFGGGEYRGSRAKRVGAGAVESYAGGRWRGACGLGMRQSRERTLQIFSQRVRDIQRQRLQTPLLGCHRVVRVPKTSSGVVFTPFACGVVCYVKWGAEGDVVGSVGWTVGEVVSGDGSWGRKGERRVLRGEKETGGEGAEAAQMVDSKWDQGNVVFI
jgi:hypothetical protein